MGALRLLDCAYNHMYTGVVAFEWDPNKALANTRKQGVQFSEALGAFGDDHAITINNDEEHVRLQ